MREAQLRASAFRLLAGSSNTILRLPYRAPNYGLLDDISAFAWHKLRTSGLESASPRGQWRTGENGENWLQNHPWCPNDPRGSGIDDDDDDDTNSERNKTACLLVVTRLAVYRLFQVLSDLGKTGNNEQIHHLIFLIVCL